MVVGHFGFDSDRCFVAPRTSSSFGLLLLLLFVALLLGCASAGSGTPSNGGGTGDGTGGGGTGGGGGGGGGGGSSPGEFLYSANVASSDLSGFQVNSDGSLTPLSSFPVSTAQNPRSLAAAGNYLLLSNGLDNNGNNGQIVLYKVDPQTGNLSKTSNFATSPNYVAMTPKGDFAYDSESGIAGYSTAGGTLAQLASSPYFYGELVNGNVNPLTPDRLLV